MKLGQEMIDTRWQDHGELQLTLPKKKKKRKLDHTPLSINTSRHTVTYFYSHFIYIIFNDTAKRCC